MIITNNEFGTLMDQETRNLTLLGQPPHLKSNMNENWPIFFRLIPFLVAVLVFWLWQHKKTGLNINVQLVRQDV